MFHTCSVRYTNQISKNIVDTIARSTVIMTRNKFITKWNLAHIFMVLEVISQKSTKSHCGEFFYHAVKLWSFSYTKSRWKIYCLFPNFPVIQIQNVFYYFYFKGEMLKILFQETNCIYWGTDFQDFTYQNIFFSFFLQGKIAKYVSSQILYRVYCADVDIGS